MVVALIAAGSATYAQEVDSTVAMQTLGSAMNALFPVTRPALEATGSS